MNFILNFFTFENIVLGIVGTIGIVGLVISLRAMRKDRPNYTLRHDAMEKRIQETEKSIRDHNNTMQSSEQLHIMATALKDFLQQKGHNAEDIILENADQINIKLPHGTICVQHTAKTIQLQSLKKNVHGQGLWQVRQNEDAPQSFQNLMQVERYLVEILRKAEL